jgi:membrane-associated phospholipid phosphatase
VIAALSQLDSELFIAINNGLANPVCDLIMPLVTNSWVLRVVLGVIVLGLAIFGRSRGRIAALGCVVAVALSDQISAQLLKPLVARVRPCHVIDGVRLLVDCSQGLSFPSSHAANTFGQAVFLGVLYPRARWFLVAFAAVVSYSRIAVGVHYPLDVVAGAVVGIFAGSLTLVFWRLAERRWPSLKRT